MVELAGGVGGGVGVGIGEAGGVAGVGDFAKKRAKIRNAQNAKLI